jgi:hypothetical protein
LLLLLLLASVPPAGTLRHPTRLVPVWQPVMGICHIAIQSFIRNSLMDRISPEQ